MELVSLINKWKTTKETYEGIIEITNDNDALVGCLLDYPHITMNIKSS